MNSNRLTGFDPPPARVFAWRVMELKKQGVGEDEAVAVADVMYSILKKPFLHAVPISFFTYLPNILMYFQKCDISYICKHKSFFSPKYYRG
jgi:hypothetical protein